MNILLAQIQVETSWIQILFMDHIAVSVKVHVHLVIHVSVNVREIIL